MTTNFEIEKIEATESNAGISGYYVADRSFTDTTPGDWTWNDRGNGPEITQDGVFGPFVSEAEAQAYIDQWHNE